MGKLGVFSHVSFNYPPQSIDIGVIHVLYAWIELKSNTSGFPFVYSIYDLTLTVKSKDVSNPQSMTALEFRLILISVTLLT